MFRLTEYGINYIGCRKKECPYFKEPDTCIRNGGCNQMHNTKPEEYKHQRVREQGQTFFNNEEEIN